MKHVKHILCVFLFAFMLGSVSLADSGYTAPDGNEYQYKVTSAYNSGFWYSVYSDYKIAFCETSKNNDGNYYPYGYYDSDHIAIIQSRSGYYGCSYWNPYPNGIATQDNNSYFVFWHDQSTPSYNNGFACSALENPDIPIFDTLDETLEYIMTPDIDFDTVYYSANIPVPNIKVTYSTITDTSVANVPLYVEFSDRGNLSGLYIDYRVQFLPVNYISVNVQRGNVTYSRIDPDTNYVTYDVVSNSDLQLIDDLYYQSFSDNYMTRYKTVMSEKWGEFLSNYSPEANLSFTFPTNLNAGLQEMYKTKYKNVRTTQTMFGNYMRIWVRYFVVDEENHYKVGAWRVWECYDSSASEWGVTMPEYYIYGDNAVGTTNVYSDENADTNQDIPMNSGTPTGENNPIIQVTVNQNVPNYPDYPTAVSYNHDNVLMQFIQTANYIPSMFSGYTSFLTAAFGFIPSGIWTIIGMGFLSCIVVMIVKVL